MQINVSRRWLIHMLNGCPRMKGYISAFGWTIAYLVPWIGIEIGSAISGQLVGHDLRVLSLVVHGAVEIAGVLGLTWLFWCKGAKSDLASLGMTSPRWAWLATGLAIGALGIALVSGIEYLLGWLHPLSLQFGPRANAPRIVYMLAWIFPSIGVGIVEELAFRGYIFETFADRGPIWVAALLSAMIFAGLHVTLGGFGVAFIATDVLMAFIFLMLRWMSGSLWLPIGVHAAWDYVQTVVVGLSTTGSGSNDPALLPIHQTGPALWVGSSPAIEGGLLYMGLTLLAFIGLLTLTTSRANLLSR